LYNVLINVYRVHNIIIKHNFNFFYNLLISVKVYVYIFIKATKLVCCI